MFMMSIINNSSRGKGADMPLYLTFRALLIYGDFVQVSAVSERIGNVFLKRRKLWREFAGKLRKLK